MRRLEGEMKIWVTGGAGFLGSRLIPQLKGTNVSVVSLSRRKTSLADESIAIDLASELDALKRLLKREGPPNVVVHAASKQPGSGSFHDFAKSNALSTANLLDALSGSLPQQIIYTSTQSVYSPAAILPVTEHYRTVVPSPYAATKRLAEQVLETITKTQVIILRLPSLYGAGQRDSFIDGLAQTAIRNEPIELFSEGRLIRDALHVGDVIRAIQSCLRRPPAEQCCIMNLGCGRPITTLEYAEALVEALGSNSAIELSKRLASQVNCYADIDLARRTIGFQPTELRESMRTYADELRT